MELAAKERLEIDAWRNSLHESPESDSVENLVNKLTDAPVFLEAVERHRDLFTRARTTLELGAGQGWASCILKKLLGTAGHVTASDISPHAMASVWKWERVFAVRLDGKLNCRSYQVPLPDASVDLVFTFQAAHHFVAHRRTLREMLRILVPGGSCLYLHEPTCAQWIHGVARRRVNAKGMSVPEDVLVYARLVAIAHEVGLNVSSVFDLSLSKRGPVELVYYSALTRLPLLRHLLPCTRDIVFMKSR